MPVRPTPAPTAYDAAQQLAARLRQVFRAAPREPLGAMVDAAHAEAEARIARVAASEPAACTAGCAFCCHQQVSATAAEILVIAQRVMAAAPASRGRMRVAIRNADGRTRGLSPLARWALREPCPLLGPDRLCRVYADRPFGCRAYASRDVDACAAAFAASATGSSPLQVPRVEGARLNGVMVSVALQEALRQLGLAPHAYDLNHGLTLALEIGPKAAATRYLAGEDVISAARIGAPAPDKRPT